MTVKSNLTNSFRKSRIVQKIVMAKKEMKMIVSILIVIMLVVAQADDYRAPSSPFTTKTPLNPFYPLYRQVCSKM